MSIRTAIAASLAAAALPLAAPLAAHAVSVDCVVLTTYNDTLVDLVQQVNAAISLGREQDEWSEEQIYLSQAAELAHTAAGQYREVVRQLVSPVYKRMIGLLADDFDFEGRVLSGAVRGGLPASRGALGQVAQRTDDHGDYYDDAISSACSA